MVAFSSLRTHRRPPARRRIEKQARRRPEAHNSPGLARLQRPLGGSEPLIPAQEGRSTRCPWQRRDRQRKVLARSLQRLIPWSKTAGVVPPSSGAVWRPPRGTLCADFPGWIRLSWEALVSVTLRCEGGGVCR